MIPWRKTCAQLAGSFPRIRGGDPDIAEVEALAQAYYDALDAEDKADAEEITL